MLEERADMAEPTNKDAPEATTGSARSAGTTRITR